MKCFKPARFLKSSFLSIMVSTTVVGCFRPGSHSGLPGTGGPGTGDENEVTNATFFNDPTVGHAKEGVFYTGFSIPKSRFYTFSVCIKNKRSQDAIVSHRFEVAGGAKTQSLKSDTSGCLNWSEEIEFNFFADEKYLAVERIITAKGIHSGSRRLKLALNPWALTDAVDLSRADVPEGTLAGANEKSAKAAPLYLTSLTIAGGTVGQAKGGLTRILKLDLGVGVVTKNLAGAKTSTALKEANLTLDAMLFAAAAVGGSRQEYKVWRSAQTIQVFREGDRFRAEFPVRVENGNSSTRYRLALRVKPVNGPAGLGFFDGVYDIGSLEDLMGADSLSATLRQSNVDDSFDFAKSDETAKTLLPNENTSAANGSSNQVIPPKKIVGPGNSPENLKNAPPVTKDPSGVTRLSLFKIRSTVVAFSGTDKDSSTSRALLYQATVCLSDMSNGGRPPTDVDFEIVIGSGKKLQQRAKNSNGLEGCLQWEDAIVHRYYEVEHFIMTPITLRHIPSGWEQKLTFAMNPWDRFNLYVDPNQRPDLIDLVNKREPIKSRLIADNFGFDTLNERSYAVDSFLNLKTIKPVRIRIPLRVLRQSSITAGRSASPEPLRDGIYAFNAAIYLQTRDAANQPVEVIIPLRGGAELARVRGGELKIERAEFEVPDERFLRARAIFVFEVKPVDESKVQNPDSLPRAIDAKEFAAWVDNNSGLQTPTYSGPIWLRDEMGGSTTVANEDLMNSLAKTSGPMASRETRESMTPLAGLTVDQLIARANANDRAYQTRMAKARSLPDLLSAEKIDADYVALSNETVILGQEPGLAQHNKVLPKTGTLKAVLDVLNKGAKTAVTASQISGLVMGTKPLDTDMAARLCRLLLDKMPNAQAPGGKFIIKGRVPSAWADNCLNYLPAKNPDAFIVIDRKLRVFEMGPQKAVRALQMSLNVGSDVSFGRASSLGWSWGGGLSSGLNLLSGLVGISANVGFSKSQSINLNEGSSFSSGAALNMRQLDFDLTINVSETCAIVRANPKFIETFKRDFAIINKEIKPENAAKILQHGVMFCTGQRNKPITVRESYFTFGQGSFDATLADQGDLFNQPWVLSLRGTRDFATFMKFIEAKKTSTTEVTEEIKIGGLPVARLEEAYGAYRGISFAAPAFYTYEPTPIQVRESTWWERWLPRSAFE
jgi:hypothetical protein